MRIDDEDEGQDVPYGFWSNLLLAAPLLTSIAAAVAALFGWNPFS
jgi:hypothetical protein